MKWFKFEAREYFNVKSHQYLINLNESQSHLIQKIFRADIFDTSPREMGNIKCEFSRNPTNIGTLRHKTVDEVMMTRIFQNANDFRL
ncbi:hypothetical protein TNIN_107881 [Trichonephila inaurata madagascariensis]|uniref:Uncharacterized protein n=1 Tax=Trichonephila inaurata madagascariensis TaxID=2747483 RepID=A0A8X6YKR2_9ARAC|nr:hypothetical protein TNIN_107881 [Trichonephila inaurata madagascariensis]